MCDALHITAGGTTVSRAGKTLRVRIIAERAGCTRLQNMCNARTYPRSQPIGRTLDPQPATVQHVRVDHRRTHVAMPQQLLHRPDVIAVLEQVRYYSRWERKDTSEARFPACGAGRRGGRHGRAAIRVRSPASPQPLGPRASWYPPGRARHPRRSCAGCGA